MEVKKEPTKQRIITVALELFAIYGYSSTSVDDIAKEVGIRKASIYSHYKNKDAIYLEVVHSAIKYDVEFMKNLVKIYDRKDCKQFFAYVFMEYAKCCHQPVVQNYIKIIRRATLYPSPTFGGDLKKLFEEYYFAIDSMLMPILIDAMEGGLIRKSPPSDVIDLFHFMLDGIIMEANCVDEWKFYERVEKAVNMFRNFI